MNQPQVKLQSVKGLHCRLNEESQWLIQESVKDGIVGNGYKAIHQKYGKCTVITMGPLKGTWIPVEDHGGHFFSSFLASYLLFEAPQTPARVLTYDDHM